MARNLSSGQLVALSERPTSLETFAFAEAPKITPDQSRIAPEDVRPPAPHYPSDPGGTGIVGHQREVQVAKLIVKAAEVTDAQAHAKGCVGSDFRPREAKAFLLCQEIERAWLDLHQPARPFRRDRLFLELRLDVDDRQNQQRVVPRSGGLFGDGRAQLPPQGEAELRSSLGQDRIDQAGIGAQSFAGK